MGNSFRLLMIYTGRYPKAVAKATLHGLCPHTATRRHINRKRKQSQATISGSFHALRPSLDRQKTQAGLTNSKQNKYTTNPAKNQ